VPLWKNLLSDLTIINAVIIPMTERRKSFRGYLRTKDGVIAEVREGVLSDVRAGDRVIDARDSVLMPGLVNAHTHLYQVLMRAVWEDLPLLPWLKRIYGAARVLRPEHFYAGTLLGCVEAVCSGVTTICEHNFLNPHPECAFETVRAIRDSGLRAVFARTIMDTGEIVPECVKEQSEQAFRHIDEIIEKNKASDLLTFMTGPNTPPLNTTPELLREIRRFADHKSIGISAHVAESRSVVEFAQEKHGKSGVVAFLSDFGITGPSSIFALRSPGR
jgi:5-methylthioadenosine/S-adenosylhomocysteine deaminase